MSHSQEYLAMLPLDILIDILYNIDVPTIQELQKACKDNNRYNVVYSECTNRLSVTKYIDRYFGNGEKFMEAMSKCGASVVGPRATGFFVRSKSCDESTWEINVNYDDENVFEFVSSLSDIGVKWYTPKEEITNLLNSKNDELTIDSFKYAAILTHVMKLCRELGYQVCNSLSGSPTRVKLSASYPILSISDAAFNDDSVVRESVWMCTGHKTTSNGEVKVRLSGERERIMGYYPKCMINDHSSYRQAIINPYFAYHLYGKLACSLSTYQWTRNMIVITINSSDSSVERIPQAPQTMPGSAAALSGNFKYEPVPRTPLGGNVRAVNDYDSVWLTVPYVYHADPVGVARYVELLKCLKLLQSPGGLSSSTINQVSLSRLQPWTAFRDRHRTPVHDTEGIYIPSLWASAFGK